MHRKQCWAFTPDGVGCKLHSIAALTVLTVILEFTGVIYGIFPLGTFHSDV